MNTEIVAIQYTDNPVDESILETLRDDIRIELKQTAEYIVRTGLKLLQARSITRHGSWLRWLDKSFGMSSSTADRYMSVARRFADDGERIQGVPISILEALSESPSAAVSEVLDMFESGEKPNGHQVEVIIDQHQEGVRALAQYIEDKGPHWLKEQVIRQEIGARPAYSILKAIEGTTGDVQIAAMAHGITDPSVLPLLARYAENEPDELATIVRTGMVYWDSEAKPPHEPVPLGYITPGELREAYNSIRQERRAVDFQADAPVRHVDTRGFVHSVFTTEDGDHLVTFRVDEASMRKLETLKDQPKRLIIQNYEAYAEKQN